jgi:hypothetical protein
VDACGVDGRTSLIHAARTNNGPFALVLLENNANINAIATNGQTPLTTAITNNSHQVLKLLLDRWADFSDCPCLRGPDLLRTVAIYADLETLLLLSQTDHFRLQYDRDYSTDDFDSLLRERYDADEKHVSVFNDFMAVVREEKKMESLMEKGEAFQPFVGDIKAEKEDD